LKGERGRKPLIKTKKRGLPWDKQNLSLFLTWSLGKEGEKRAAMKKKGGSLS